MWVVEMPVGGGRLAVMPLLAVEGRNLRLLKDGLWGPLVLGVYETEHDAKVARRVAEEELRGVEGRTDRTDKTEERHEGF
jgi:hypothetical protein